MTVLAGAFCLDSRKAVPTILKTSLSANLRTHDDLTGQRHLHDSARLFLVKWDSEAFQEPAWRESADGSVCALVGDPLLVRKDSRMARQEQLDQLAPTDLPLDEALLAASRGSFSVVSYSGTSERLQLATDALGLRTIYYSIHAGILVFASALRVLEKISGICSKLSIQGMAELSAFSFPLDNRTPYENVNVLREAEILTLFAAKPILHRYDNWENSSALESDGVADSAATLHREFSEAVRVRAGSDRHVYSFLSGGMDSRAIVATLATNGQYIEALNFSAPGSQDQVFAQQLAKELGEHCRLYCLPGGIFPNFSFLALAAKRSLEQNHSLGVDRPQFIWSGDGGSVGLGHVYMDEQMIDYAADGEIENAVAHFLKVNRISIPRGIFSKEFKSNLPDQLFTTTVGEFTRKSSSDPGRQIYYFLLFNDQRRHLFKHFETIDQHGLELLTPFYDTKFLKSVIATPSRSGILHRIYAKFFEHLSPSALRTPWQTYPGHVPCPIPATQTANYQWSASSWAASNGLSARYRVAIDIIRALPRGDEAKLFSQPRIIAAALSHLVGYKDYRHILQVLRGYQRHGEVTRQAATSEF